MFLGNSGEPPILGCFDSKTHAKNYVSLQLHTETMSKRFCDTQSEIFVD